MVSELRAFVDDQNGIDDSSGDITLEKGHEAHIARCEDAAYAYCCGEFTVAANLYSELLQERCIEALIGLGYMHLRGEGVELDIEKGVALLREAAEVHPSAAYSLGALHRSGDCRVPVNAAESRRYFLLARKLGCSLPVDDYLD